MQLLGVERLGQVIGGTEAHRVHRAFDRAVPGDQHDVAFLRKRLLGQQVHPASVGEHEIDQHEVGHWVELLARFGERRGERRRVSVASDQVGKGGAGGRIVVDDEGVRHRGPCEVFGRVGSDGRRGAGAGAGIGRRPTNRKFHSARGCVQRHDSTTSIYRFHGGVVQIRRPRKHLLVCCRH